MKPGSPHRASAPPREDDTPARPLRASQAEGRTCPGALGTGSADTRREPRSPPGPALEMTPVGDTLRGVTATLHSQKEPFGCRSPTRPSVHPSRASSCPRTEVPAQRGSRRREGPQSAGKLPGRTRPGGGRARRRGHARVSAPWASTPRRPRAPPLCHVCFFKRTLFLLQPSFVDDGQSKITFRAHRCLKSVYL